MAQSLALMRRRAALRAPAGGLRRALPAVLHNAAAAPALQPRAERAGHARRLHRHAGRPGGPAAGAPHPQGVHPAAPMHAFDSALQAHGCGGIMYLSCCPLPAGSLIEWGQHRARMSGLIRFHCAMSWSRLPLALLCHELASRRRAMSPKVLSPGGGCEETLYWQQQH